MTHPPAGRACWSCLGVLLFAAVAAAAQTPVNLDFEDGLRGWTPAGDAFVQQPLDAERLDRARFPASPLGGDYWNVVPYPLGHHGRFLVRSDEAGRGTLTSEAFALGANDRYFSVLVGGPDAPATQRVELQVLDGSGAAAVAWQTTGPGLELLQQRVFALPAGLAGRLARIVIIDDSPDAHITVDDAKLTPDPPTLDRGPVWGLADFHTHPMSHLAFGGLRGVPVLWGRPGTTAASYAQDPSLFELDIPECPDDHGGGRTAGILVNTVEKRLLPQDVKPRGFLATLRALLKLVTGRFTRHGDDGAPRFDDYPTFLSGAHHQMHVTQIHRAWQGGLRLMVAIAVHNEGVEFLASPARDRPPTTEREVLEAQVCGMRRLAALNADWMQIAYAPGEARDIIHSGKLAVILGAEFDRLGEMEGFASPDDEVQYLWDLGIRQVTPIHGIDNRLGGAAIFEPAYNSLNDLLKRGPLNLGGGDLDLWEPVFFDIRDGGCPPGAPAARGECVLFKLRPVQDRAVVSRTIFSPFSATPNLREVEAPRYRDHSGHLNTRGLTEDGRSYLRSLIARGMLVGLEHMSQRSVEDTYRLVEGTGYPLLVSHAHFRALAIQDRRRTTAVGFLPDEYDISDSTLAMVRRTGGVTGVFTLENPIDEHPLVTAPFAHDCAGSSKTFAYSLLYGISGMGGAGVGLATDFTFIPATGPRFGEHACWGLEDHWDARPGVGPLRDQYRPERQDRGVRYEGLEVPPGVRIAANAALTPYTMGERTFDFNVDGFAHYGLLPDLLQDVRNIGVGAEAFEALFSSAEAYIATWEQAARLSEDGAALRPFTPLPLPCDDICRGLCP
jgi:microsomal dipeptidase-like Zn-dependent dipeptidase